MSLKSSLIEPEFRGQVEEGELLMEFETKLLEKWKENKSSELSSKEREEQISRRKKWLIK